ncbi:smf Mn2+ and Fe2+ transporter [Wolfiporia cocos MD-104 SS10]|uniref:Smf Mn2+ and Fe2+ transporter n=1 Tax=Wolfiporia cocos (strain MD-104) TaxID=742152 RepID=A0A2H3IXX3_WOLCO|nr:smf Mn2+ and Fe2+ transporter [Wolfiporia cocos MD-104 SS10]
MAHDLTEQTATVTATPATVKASPNGLRRVSSSLKETLRVIFKHATKHTGVGIICAVAYFDPGNWGVDLQAGSQFGYKLLFIVLLSGLVAIYMQVLSSRLGCVTGLDLASHCRLLLHDRPKHTLLWRWLVLYPLYALAEVAIVATDLAELLGSAIALCLLFPSLPLWAGVLLTASDVLLLLAMRDPLGGKPARLFEVVIAALVFTVLICMAVIISKAGVHWGVAFDGFVPSRSVVSSEGLYTSIGILGATVMPHSLFLGSAFATQERESPASKDLNDSLSKVETKELDTDDAESVPEQPRRSWWQPREWPGRAAKFFRDCFRVTPVEKSAHEPKNHSEIENHSFAFVKTHLWHGIVDMCISLLGIAVVINSLILMLASAEFYYGFGETGNESPATLFDAYDLLRELLGKPAATLFALALLASGQSSSIIATLAGQTVSEGFIRWRVSPVLRRLITRVLGLIPSTIVAAALGRGGVSALLVISQVVLSIVLPFIVFPLIYITSSKRFMGVKRPRSQVSQAESSDANVTVDVEVAGETVDFSNGRIMTVLGWIQWIVIVLANAYAIVTLAMGED